MAYKLKSEPACTSLHLGNNFKNPRNLNLTSADLISRIPQIIAKISRIRLYLVVTNSNNTLISSLIVLVDVRQTKLVTLMGNSFDSLEELLYHYTNTELPNKSTKLRVPYQKTGVKTIDSDARPLHHI